MNNTIIYVAKNDTQNVVQGERYPLFLDTMFHGYNLWYNASPSPVAGLTFEQALQVQVAVQQNISQLLSASLYLEPDGNVVVALLVYNATEQVHSIWFGQSDKGAAPVFNHQVDLEDNTTSYPFDCYDVTLLNQTLAVASCNLMKDIDNMDFDSCYFIAAYGLGSSTSFQIFDDFTENAIPYDRRGLSFQSTNSIGITAQIFMSWVSFADMDGQNDQNFVSVYRYLSPQVDEPQYPAGFLTELPPLSANIFGLQDMQIADMATLGNNVFLLEYMNGIYLFQYQGQQVVNLQHFMPFIPYFTGFYAIGVQYNGAEVIVELATGSSIYEFILVGMGTNSPQFYFSQIYELDFQINNDIIISINNDYLVLQIGQITQVFKRKYYSAHRNQQNHIVGQMNTFLFAQLLYSDTLFAFNTSGTYNLQLFRPAMVFQPTANDMSSNFTLYAISYAFSSRFPTAVCTLDIQVQYIPDPLSTKMWPTNYNLDIQETVVGMQPVILDLDEMYIGPNIRYYIQYSQFEKSLSIDEVEEEELNQPISQRNLRTESIKKIKEKKSKLNQITPDANIWIDQPRGGRMNIPYKNGNLSDIIFMKTVQEYFNSKFYQVFGDQQGNLAMYECVTTDFQDAVVDCTMLRNLTNQGQINAWTTSPSFLRGVQIQAYTTSNYPNVVQFRDFYGNYYFNRTYGSSETVIDIAIDLNCMYVIVDVGADLNNSYIDLVAFNISDKSSYSFAQINQNTIVGWNVSRLFTWSPVKLLLDRDHEFTLFIQVTTGVLAVDCSVVPSFLFYNNYPMAIFPMPLVYLSNDQLIFVETGTTFEESRISEYSINNLNSIQYNKHFLTYGLTPLFGNQTQSVQTISATTQNLYLIVYNTTNITDETGQVIGNFTEASVFIYEGNQPQFSTLYDYQNIEMFQNGTIPKQILISADGAPDEDNLVVLFNGKLSYSKVPMDFYLNITSQLNDPTVYAKQINYTILVTPWSPIQQSQQFQETVYLVQTGTSILPNEQNIINSGIFNKLNLPNNSVTLAVPFNPSNWYYGAYLGVNLTCTNGVPCGLFSIQNKMYMGNRDINNLQNVQDTFFDDEDRDVIWVMTEIYPNIQLLSFDTNFYPYRNPIYFDMQGDFDCELILPGYITQQQFGQKTIRYELAMLYIVCIDVNHNNYAIVPIPDPYGLSPYPATPLQMEDVFFYHQIQFIDGNFLLAQEGSVWVYQPVYSKGTMALKVVYNDATLGTDSLIITNFQVVPTDNPQRRLVFLLNDSSCAAVIEVSSQDYTYIYNLNNVTVVQLKPILFSAQLFLTSRSRLRSLTMAQFSVSNQSTNTTTINRLIYDMLLLTSDTAIYEIEFDFESYMLADNIYFLYAQPTTAYQTYGDNIPMYLETSKGPFAVSYLNFSTNMASICIYERGYHSDEEIEDRIKMRNNLALSEEKLSQYPAASLVQINAGHNYPNFNPTIGLIFNWYQDMNHTGGYNLMTVGHNLSNRSLHQFLYNPRFAYFNITGNNFVNQTVSIWPVSDFMNMVTDSVLVNVTKEGISPVPPGPNPPEPKNNTPYIILGSVLGGVLVIGVVAYLIYYIRKKRSEVGFQKFEKKIVSEEKEDAQSLQNLVKQQNTTDEPLKA